MKKVMVFGTFDGIHPGHLFFLNNAKKHGQYFIVVIARDETVKEIKGKWPRLSHHQRKKQVMSLRIAQKVTIGNKFNKYKVIDKYRPDIICLGYDQKAFTENLKKAFPKIKIFRLKAYYPNKFKSSLLP